MSSITYECYKLHLIWFSQGINRSYKILLLGSSYVGQF